MRVALAQSSGVLGDLQANLEEAHQLIRRAADAEADLVVFPELFLSGYALGKMAPESIHDVGIEIGDSGLASLSEHGPDVAIGLLEDARLRRYNSAAYLSRGRLVHLHRKLYLPNYLVWEERKHAQPGQSLRAYDTDLGRMATLICNDAWQPMLPWLSAQDGAEVLLIPTNSAHGLTPGSMDSDVYWRDLLLGIARMQQCWVIFCNRVGEEAGIKFWGGSRVLDPWGNVVAQSPMWDESLTFADIDVSAARRRRREMPLLAEARLGLLHRELGRLIEENGED